eukprot:scaffold68837_cov18-Tisochrysis_lutea.AAC.1
MNNKTQQAKRQMEEAMLKLMVSQCGSRASDGAGSSMYLCSSVTAASQSNALCNVRSCQLMPGKGRLQDVCIEPANLAVGRCRLGLLLLSALSL